MLRAGIYPLNSRIRALSHLQQVPLGESRAIPLDGGCRFVVSWWRSPGLNSVATGVRTGAVDGPLGWNRRSPAENGSKSLNGGRTVREGASISGTAVADLERDGGGFLRGLERESAA